MRVIIGVPITSANMTSNVAEPYAGETAWSAATTYTLGTEVIRTTTHRKYKNILAGADAGLPENTPSRWTEIGVTNKFAMFDQYRNTQTVVPSPLTATITPGKRINSIFLGNMSNGYLTIVVTEGGNEIYRYEKDLSSRVVTNYYEYAYAEFSNIKSIALFDLPPTTTAVITVTLTSSTGTVKCGALVVGNQTYIGSLQQGARLSSLNFSTIDRSAIDGTATLLPRKNKPKVVGKLFAPTMLTEKIEQIKVDTDAVPAVWSGLDDQLNDPRYSSLLISGLCRQLEQSLDYPTTNLIDIELEEL